MISPCETCGNPAVLIEASNKLAYILTVLDQRINEAWNDAAMLGDSIARLAGDGTELTPGERAGMEQSRENVSRATARFVSRSVEAKEFMEAGLKTTAHIDCGATGCELRKVCPRLSSMGVVLPVFLDIMGQTSDPNP